MKVFISYSHKDRKFVDLLANKLLENGVDVWWDSNELSVGQNIAEKIKDAINRVDYFVIVLSKSSSYSNWVNYELSAILLNETSKQETIILPVLLEDCEIPFALKNRLFADFRSSFDQGLERLLRSIFLSKKETYRTIQETIIPIIDTYEFQIKNLSIEYNKGNLSLFCGAGISYDAGVPTWNMLLKTLLKEIYSDNQLIPNIDSKLANIFQNKINLSPLILAQYLKILLEKKFTETVRDALYAQCTDRSLIIDSIVELIRPKRNRKNLLSVVNFNFDDLVESKLSAAKIDFKSIYTEGERFKETEFPIFHPHGYLPRGKKLTVKNEIVFSEDAYHSQFIDPFIWSNLVQLNHLNNNTCLFIGISLTDPNMRRLLDVSIRKNGKGEKNHYIIKKRYKVSDLYPDKGSLNIKSETIIPIVENIEEQDANHLGFNVIWVNDYTEIPKILFEIGKK
jgi:hypothetical protein